MVVVVPAEEEEEGASRLKRSSIAFARARRGGFGPLRGLTAAMALARRRLRRGGGEAGPSTFGAAMSAV